MISLDIQKQIAHDEPNRKRMPNIFFKGIIIICVVLVLELLFSTVHLSRRQPIIEFPHVIGVSVTACGREDLLRLTLNSFDQFATDIAAKVLVEDCNTTYESEFSGWKIVKTPNSAGRIRENRIVAANKIAYEVTCNFNELVIIVMVFQNHFLQK